MAAVVQQIRADHSRHDSGVGTLESESMSNKKGPPSNYEDVMMAGTTTITLGSPNGSPVRLTTDSG